jgi:hypothetical protein
LINLIIFGIAILISSIGVVAVGSQTVLASICPPMCIDIDADEAAMAGNVTNMTTGNVNQTESENMTSMMDSSTS